jgi:hypothetical protein
MLAHALPSGYLLGSLVASAQELNRQRLIKHATQENINRIGLVPDNIRQLEVQRTQPL